VALKIKTFQQLVSSLVASWAGALNLVPNLTPGDPLLAIMESIAINIMYILRQINAVYAYARLSTCKSESDVDSFIADYGLQRQQSQQAIGLVTFSLAAPTTSDILIAEGATIGTEDTLIQYTVIGDTSLPGWDNALGAYVIPAGQTTVSARVESVNAGTAYNVQADQLTVTTLTGLSVTNDQPILNGKDKATNDEVKAQFILYINSLARATKGAITYAIVKVRQGLDFALYENLNAQGVPKDGFFLAIINDGSGAPPKKLLDQISDSIEEYRAFTVEYDVIPPLEIWIYQIAIYVHLKPGVVLSSKLINTIKNAVLDHVNTRKIGETLYFSQVLRAVQDSDDSILGVGEASGVLLTQDDPDRFDDIPVFYKHILRIRSESIIVSTY